MKRVYDATLRLLGSVDTFRASIDDIHDRMGGRLEIALFDPGRGKASAFTPGKDGVDAVGVLSAVRVASAARCTGGRSR